MRTPLPVMLMFAAACGAEGTPDPGQADTDFATELAIGLAEACPMSGRNDEAARLSCGDNLAKLALLRDHMVEPFLWGGQGAGKPLDLAENSLTRFNPLAW